MQNGRGSAWDIQTVDSTQYSGEYSSIALDSSGNPHISYFDGYEGNLKYAGIGQEVYGAYKSWIRDGEIIAL